MRRAEQVPAVEATGAQSTVVGDLRNSNDLARACLGVETIYHICPNMHPNEIEIAQDLLAVAKAASVKRIVYHSVLHPQIQAMPHHWNKLRVEELIFESGLDYTILQPAAYMQNVLASWQAIVEEGTYRVPYAIDTKLGMVDLHDVAEVAATVLTRASDVGATYELCSQEVLTPRTIVAILSTALERSVHAEKIALDAWQSDAKVAGLGAYQIDTLSKMFLYYEQHGFWGNPTALQMLCGRRPTSFTEFVERTIYNTKRR